MNHIPAAPPMPPTFRNHPGRRQNEYPYPAPPHHAPPPPHHLPYPNYHHPQQYHGPPPMHPYAQQWYQPYQPYGPPAARAYPQQPPLVVSSHPHAQPVVPVPRQPLQTPQPTRTPQPEISTPSTTSQAVASPSTTPTTTSVNTSTPPASAPKPPRNVSNSDSPTMPFSVQQPAVRMPYYPSLPWLSVPESEFPPRTPRRRRRRKPTQISSDEVELPARGYVHPVPTEEDQSSSVLSIATPPAESETPSASAAASEILSTDPTTPSSPAAAVPLAASQAPPTPSHKRTATKPVIPIVPIIPVKKPQQQPSITSPTLEEKALPVEKDRSTEDIANDASPQASESTPVSSPPPPPLRAPPKSWAELLRSNLSNVNGPATGGGSGVLATNGVVLPKSSSVADVLRYFSVENWSKISFLEPRGLVNTGNMCYMNAILQILVFCVPFYEFLDQVGKRVVHNSKSETPLLQAMIMFMREYNIIDSAVSVGQLRMRLKDKELEQYGEPFAPEYVYDVINRLPRFASMRRGHQQDAEEFLGFLLEGLHNDCAQIMKEAEQGSSPSLSEGVIPSPIEQSEEPSGPADGGWLEVGPKQKAAVTRSSGAIITESPLTKIFGGKLRSVFRVPGLKDSVTLEPYQPLQLDIGAPNIQNITDALKGLTRSETIHGEFNSPRGPGTTATKQVFIETLPPVLILHLKRFQYDNAGGTQKIWKKVGYPLDLEIPKEAFPQQQRATLSMRPGGLPKYRLIGVVYHHGKNASNGHYTVDVRRQDGREWIRIDDTIIRRMRTEDVANEGGEEDPKVLAKALEQHKRDTDAGKNIYSQVGFGDDEEDDDEDSRGGWNQVNGSSMSPTMGPTKKWSSVANGPGTTSPGATASGKQTPKGNPKHFIKDNKVAYILFYQQIKL